MSSEVAEPERAADRLLDDWREIAVADVVTMLPGFAFKSENFVTDTDAGLPLIRIRDLGLTNTATRYVGYYDEAFAVRDGDILIGMDGAFDAVRWQGGKALLNQRVLKLSSARPNAIDDGYLFYRVQPTLSELEQTISGTTVKHLSTKDLKRLVWKLPPLGEQRRIAEVLRSVDEAIVAKRAVLLASKLFKRTCREAAVARFQHHAPSKLQSVLSTIDAGWSPDCDSEPANDGEWSILKTSAVVWEGYDDEENKRLPPHLEPRPLLEVEADDILITRAGPAERTGVIAIVRQTAGRRMLSDKIIRLRVDRKKAVPLAIAELLSSNHVQGELIRSKSGMAASQTNISQKIVLGLEMHLPPLREQRDFAEEMAALQDAIEVSEADLQNTHELKAALMSDLLSGRVRLPA